MAHLLYLLSVPLPFHGDYIGLQSNPKLQKLKGGEEGPVLMAETVKKVNRGNGKVQTALRGKPPSLFFHSLGQELDCDAASLLKSLAEWKWGVESIPIFFLTPSCSFPRLPPEFCS